jgi:hypothetical protein
MQRLVCSARSCAPPRIPAAVLAHVLEMNGKPRDSRSGPSEILALLGLLSIVLDAGDPRPDD